MGTRDFSAEFLRLPLPRSIEDAPDGMRQELVDVIYQSAELGSNRLSVDDDLYLIIEQTLGISAAGNPIAGKRQRIGRDLGQAAWSRVYDVIARVYPEYRKTGAEDAFRVNVNAVLSAHGIAWDLGADGKFHRVVPAALTQLFSEGVEHLSAPGYEAGLELYRSAQIAFDDRPRRDRQALSDMFDAMEAVAKIKLSLPNATFGTCLAEAEQRGTFNTDIIGSLKSLNTLRNRHFGHGMTTPFSLTSAEVEFAYASCVGGIILFSRPS